MFNTFNMGVGMSVTVKKGEENKAVEILKESGEEAYVMGEVIKADGGVVFA